jgi:hypothetical protein
MKELKEEERQGRLIKGIWYSKEDLEKGLHLKISNPSGFNKFKKNQEVKKETPKLSPYETFKKIQDLRNEKIKLQQDKRELNSKILSNAQFISIYEDLFYKEKIIRIDKETKKD